VLELDPALGCVSIVLFNEVVTLARKNFVVSEWVAQADGVCLNLREVEESELEKYFSWEVWLVRSFWGFENQKFESDYARYKCVSSFNFQIDHFLFVMLARPQQVVQPNFL
jgi:hypothetical protein